MEDEKVTTAIQRLDDEIAEENKRQSTLKEQLGEIKAVAPEFAEVERLTAELDEAKVKLKVALEGTRDWTAISEELADVQFKIKDLKEILSSHVTRYWRETEESQVLLADGKSAKQVIITGKLGKVEAYQERMELAQ